MAAWHRGDRGSGHAVDAEHLGGGSRAGAWERAKTKPEVHVIGQVRCSLGLHSWGVWQNAGQAPCTSIRVCRICGVEDDPKEEHAWGEWTFTSTHDCAQERTCDRCERRETQVAHYWVWEYESADSCAQVQICRRCRRVNPNSRQMADHRWGSWEYESPTSCVQIRYCRRCHEPNRGQEVHRWGEWQQEQGTRRRRVCTHCNRTDHG